MNAQRIIVRGRVQGVGYRDWARREALELGLSGWVRNRRDGSVEILAAGDAAGLAALADRCRTGPCGARVDAVEMIDAGEEAVGAGFVQAPTM